MWALKNETPYSAERTWVLDKHGARSWVVVVKGTFDIRPDQSTVVSEQQVEPFLIPQYAGEPGVSSVLYDADMVAGHPHTDVILNGTAYAPAGRPIRQVDVQLSVERSFSKRMRVFGERIWSRSLLGGMSFSPPDAFESMSLRYERSFGGWDCASPDPSHHRLFAPNPIGTGYAIQKLHLDGKPLPNLEDPSQPIQRWNDHPMPAGFGCIASFWSPRRELAGTYDDGWYQHQFPLLPLDFDDRFHQCAPRDQQVAGYLRGGESILLENLSPSGTLCFRLPKTRLTFTTFFGQKSQEHRAQLHTVILEPDSLRVIMVWHSMLPCQSRVDELDATLIREKEYL